MKDVRIDAKTKKIVLHSILGQNFDLEDLRIKKDNLPAMQNQPI